MIAGLGAALASRKEFVEKTGSSTESVGRSSYEGSERPTTISNGYLAVSHSRGDLNFAGILNQGATCYLNSLLQALYCTPGESYRLHDQHCEMLYLWKKCFVV